MDSEEHNERTALLSDDGSSIIEPTYKSSLRRRSSAALPPYHEDRPITEEPESTSLAIWVVVPISLVGVFVANADGSLVVASSQQIASEFDALFNAQWLVMSFVLAQCATQSLYGKLSDIFGRKVNLSVAYIFFALGCLLCGAGQQYWHVIAGRAISGIGGAGMTALVSVIISDMVPVRSVATWRSYVNVAATTGRSLGGPVGGWLCDTVGWRWCFYGQVPITLVGLMLILWKMPKSSPKASGQKEQSLTEKWKRVDILGAVLIASSVSAFLVLLDFIAREAPAKYLMTVAVVFIVLAAGFAVTEKYIAKEPILPLRLLLARPAITAYLIAGFQMAAQFGVFYSVPIYFQISSDANVAQAGLHLVPAVVGNATAGLLSGYIISKTGRYKLLTVLSVIFACTGYTLVTVRWRGNTNWFETLYIFAGGFASGATQSTTFIHLAASLDPEEMAIAGTTLYLAGNLFLMIGVQTSTTILHIRLRQTLHEALKGVKHRSRVIEEAVSSVQAIRELPEHVRAIVVRGYVDSLTWTFGASVVWASFGLLVGLTVQEQKLE